MIMIIHCLGWPWHLPSILDLHIVSSEDDPPTQSKHKAHLEEKEGEKARRRQSGRREDEKRKMQMERKERNCFISIVAGA